ncbi:acyl-CoA reductase [Longimicrobium sp.]|uniref:acyl-CoA reductase n=1 Tax=Longimicrobium sp. TaxID=2029185 RepID=UPI003B3A5D26
MRSDVIDAFHLPAIEHPRTSTWAYGRGEDAFEVRLPRVSPVDLKRQVEALGTARDRYLAHRPVAEIVGVIDRVAARFQDPADPLRRAAERALPAVTAYSAPMIRLVLDRMAADWRAPRLRELLRAEFGDPRVLDGFHPAPRAHGQQAAFGPRLAVHVFSGNVPGVAVTSIIRSLLVKAATLGKAAVGEPLLAALFARGVAEADARIGECLAVTYWAGGDEIMERAALADADAVVVYGGAEAVASIRARTPPTGQFLGYGPKVSFGVVGRGALSGDSARAAARGAALDASTFDQQGCVSPHLFYAEEGGAVSPEAWSAMLAEEMALVEGELPRGTLAPGESSAIRQLRAEAEFAEAGGGGTRLHASGEGTAWTVLYDPRPDFTASCLNRVVRVKPVASLADVPGLVERYAPVLQTVGIAADADETRALATALARVGASRFTPLGKMAWPPPWWHHDGRSPLRELVRWADLEE